MESPAVATRHSLILVSDFVCPWCYVGIATLDRLTETHPLELRYAPYLLDPSTPPEGKPRQQFTKPGNPLSQLELRGQELGITFARGREWTSNSRLAHEAAEFASERPERHAFHRRVLRAYFEELEDIGQLETIVRLGDEVGLPAIELREVLTEGRYRQDVEDGLQWARDVGVRAVPTFIFDERYGVVGAQPLDVLTAVVERLDTLPADDDEDDSGQGED